MANNSFNNNPPSPLGFYQQIAQGLFS